MPRKIRELQVDLRHAGAYAHATEGDHTKWKHDLVPGTLMELAEAPGDDARPYQERDLRRALERIAEAERARHNARDIRRSKMAHDPRYAMLIEWSDEDEAFIVSFPEWEEQQDLIGHTHGATYEEAARKGAEVLALLVRSARADGDPLPVPRRFDAHATLATAR